VIFAWVFLSLGVKGNDAKAVRIASGIGFSLTSSISSSITRSIGLFAMEQEEKVRENRLRRMAERRGMQLQKSRRRDPQAIDFGGYMLVDARRNFVIIGAEGWAFSATLDDVEQYLTEMPSKK
jgi:hypothetical protein